MASIEKLLPGAIIVLIVLHIGLAGLIVKMSHKASILPEIMEARRTTAYSCGFLAGQQNILTEFHLAPTDELEWCASERINAAKYNFRKEDAPP